MKYKKCNIIDIHIHDGQYTINILSTVVYFFKIVSHCGICNGAVANLLGFIPESLLETGKRGEHIQNYEQVLQLIQLGFDLNCRNVCSCYMKLHAMGIYAYTTKRR